MKDNNVTDSTQGMILWCNFLLWRNKRATSTEISNGHEEQKKKASTALFYFYMNADTVAQ